MAQKFYTHERLAPNVEHFLADGRKGDGYTRTGVSMFGQVYPRGYAGWGGEVGTAPLSVAISITANLTSGQEFTATPDLGGMETVSLFNGVTMLPIKSASQTFSMPYAAAARYLNTVSSLGDAAMAVTWITTTSASSGTGTVFTRRTAEYDLVTLSEITGEFLIARTCNKEAYDFRGGGMFERGGGMGHEYPNATWTVSAGGFGRLSYTEYPDGLTVGNASVLNMDDFDTFTVGNGNAFAYRGEALLQVSLTRADHIAPDWLTYRRGFSP
jgi:hypothetical protein